MENKLAKTTVISALILTMIACSPTEKIYTVPDLKKDEALRFKVSAWCRENLDERRDVPNCKNARHALQELQYEAAKANIGK
jgi:hypothetical protein